MNFKGRSLLTLQDFSKDEIAFILRLSMEYKILTKANTNLNSLKNKCIGLFFALPSTRTRVSFEVAISKLGGYPIYMRPEELQLIRGETLADTARVLSRYLNAIVARVPKHESLEELARHSSIPVVNALTDMFHPCQALADLLTILEKKGSFKGIKLAYVGDGYNNVCHSLLIACSKIGLNIAVASPKGYEPDERVVEEALENAKLSGSKVEILNSPIEAVRNADVIYTDVFISMGREKEREKRLKDFQGWQINKEIVKYAKRDYIFMHCLPAHRGEEVAAEIIDDPIHSVIWDQAENRLYAEMAILALLIP